MAGWNWLAGFNDQQQFELFKIVLEKGLLAAIVAIAGGIFAILLERYKSALKKQEELSKVIVPQIVSTLEAAEALYEHGTQTIRTLDKQALSFVAWKEALIQSPASIETNDRYTGPDDIKRPIVECEGKLISIAELLERTAPDDLVKSVLRHPEFAVQRAESKEMEFLYALHLALKMQPESRAGIAGASLAQVLFRSIFVPLVRAPRDEYHEKVDKFVLAMMRRLPTENQAQKRAYENINNLIPRLREVIDRFPTSDIVKIEGAKSSFQQLAHLHAGLVSNLRAMLNAV